MAGRANEQLQYEPVPIRLSGNVVIEKYFGVPGYGEDPKPDDIEMSPILILDRPVDVIGNPNDSLNSEMVENVMRMYLVLQSHEQIERLKGHHVVVEGTLFHAHTGHRHTDVLIEVDKAAVAGK
jgi:Domain of unknown function (DUF4431)